MVIWSLDVVRDLWYTDIEGGDTERVRPKNLAANGIFWGWKKKWEIQCGECYFVWIEKVPINEPSQAICKACGVINQWSPYEWQQYYM